MELDDMFLMGKRPITLRLVLGLMEDADNSLETYRWATPALLHSIHTKDTTISDYVKEVFAQKGLTPYKPYKEEEPASCGRCLYSCCSPRRSGPYRLFERQ